MVITSSQAKEVTVGLYNVSGTLLQQKTVYCQPGANSISWDLGKFPAGNYYLPVEGLDVENVKVVKQ